MKVVEAVELLGNERIQSPIRQREVSLDESFEIIANVEHFLNVKAVVLFSHDTW